MEQANPTNDILLESSTIFRYSSLFDARSIEGEYRRTNGERFRSTRLRWLRTRASRSGRAAAAELGKGRCRTVTPRRVIKRNLPGLRQRAQIVRLNYVCLPAPDTAAVTGRETHGRGVFNAIG